MGDRCVEPRGHNGLRPWAAGRPRNAVFVHSGCDDRIARLCLVSGSTPAATRISWAPCGDPLHVRPNDAPGSHRPGRFRSGCACRSSQITRCACDWSRLKDARPAPHGATFASWSIGGPTIRSGPGRRVMGLKGRATRVPRDSLHSIGSVPGRRPAGELAGDAWLLLN